MNEELDVGLGPERAGQWLNVWMEFGDDWCPLYKTDRTTPFLSGHTV